MALGIAVEQDAQGDQDCLGTMQSERMARNIGSFARDVMGTYPMRGKLTRKQC
jgi:hypothetical protein